MGATEIDKTVMEATIKIQNLKCGGCATTISNKVNALEGVSNVQVHVEESTVTFKYVAKEQVDFVKEKLSSIGYPMVDEKNPLHKKAQSYVSCAIGKISK
ncbi:heavy-metal-associated domain-containing protein [Wenyingzhuangia sp. IMCC45574]